MGSASGQLLVPQCNIKVSGGKDRPVPTCVASAESRNQPLRPFRNQRRFYPPRVNARASEVPKVVTIQFDASANAQ